MLSRSPFCLFHSCLILILGCKKIELSVATPRSCGAFTVPPHRVPIVDDFEYDLQSMWNRKNSQRLSNNGHYAKELLLRGTRFSLRFPTSDRVAAWYTYSKDHLHHRPRDDCDHVVYYNDTVTTINDRRRCVFNHNLVGMTHPTLQVVTTNVSSNSRVLPLPSIKEDSSSSNTPASSKTRKWTRITSLLQICRVSSGGDRSRQPTVLPESGSDLWWPGMTHSPNNNDWRVLRFRQRVGNGQPCYERCRDAALAWEFRGEGQGIVLVEETSVNWKPTGSPFSIRWRKHTSNPRNVRSCSLNARNNQDEEYQQVSQGSTFQQMWTGPGRRLVTYTAVPKRGGWIVPHLYTVNPVTVVYDVVDQRAPGTTYTATAYATQAGHLLCGEERVLVCYRDDDGGVDVEILSVSRAADSVPGRLVWPFIGRMQRRFFQGQLDSLHGVAQGTDQ